MILDSSAAVSILLQEPGWETLVAKVAGAPVVGVGSPTLAETGIVFTAKLGADSGRILPLFLVEAGIAVIPFGEAHWRAAVDAYRRYSRGRHKAGLNFGDCMSYATAKIAGQPLLCTGREFRLTDLAIA